MDSMVNSKSMHFNSMLQRVMVKEGMKSVPNSLKIYKADELVLVIDENFGSLSHLRELFYKIAFPT